jgi:hypothetical protein
MNRWAGLVSSVFRRWQANTSDEVNNNTVVDAPSLLWGNTLPANRDLFRKNPCITKAAFLLIRYLASWAKRYPVCFATCIMNKDIIYKKGIDIYGIFYFPVTGHNRFVYRYHQFCLWFLFINYMPVYSEQQNHARING